MRVATRRLYSSHPGAVARRVAQGHRSFSGPSIAATAAVVGFRSCARFYSGESRNDANDRHLRELREFRKEPENEFQQWEAEENRPYDPIQHLDIDAELPSPRQKWRDRPLTIPKSAKDLPLYVDATGQTLQISWHENGLCAVDERQRGFDFHPTQLRDGCQCPKCVDPSSGQKSFSSTQVPTGIRIKNAEYTDGGVVVTTNGDLSSGSSTSHTITIPWVWFQNHFSRGAEPINSRMLQLQRRFGVEHWDADVIARKVRKIDYHEYMKGEGAFWDVVQDLVRLGIVFLKNVPRDENSIVEITTRMANIRETFYGRTFDVRAKPNAENVAYTSGYLGLHQDLLYLQPPPKIQVLHCMDNSCNGGESLFSDADRVGRMMWQLRKQAPISNLAHINVWYGYEKYGHRYMRGRPVLNANPASEHVYGGVYWSPPFQKPFRGGIDLYRWIKGARIFESFVNDESAMYQTKMAPGEAVFFDNMRVLHGRTAFDAAGGGSRWLRGAYISSEDFISRASYAPETHACSMENRSLLWSPAEAEAELMKTVWYTRLSNRVGRVQRDIQADQLGPAEWGRRQKEAREDRSGFKYDDRLATRDR